MATADTITIKVETRPPASAEYERWQAQFDAWRKAVADETAARIALREAVERTAPHLIELVRAVDKTAYDRSAALAEVGRVRV